jgi:hypothetical protein
MFQGDTPSLLRTLLSPNEFASGLAIYNQKGPERIGRLRGGLYVRPIKIVVIRKVLLY